MTYDEIMAKWWKQPDVSRWPKLEATEIVESISNSCGSVFISFKAGITEKIIQSYIVESINKFDDTVVLDYEIYERNNTFHLYGCFSRRDGPEDKSED